MTAGREYRIVSTAPEQAKPVAHEGEAKPLAPQEDAGQELVTPISTGTEINIHIGNYQKASLG